MSGQTSQNDDVEMADGGDDKLARLQRLLARTQLGTLHDSTRQATADRQAEPYVSIAPDAAKEAHLAQVQAAEQQGPEGFLNAVKDSGRYGLHANEEAATRAAADSLAARVVADKGAEQPRSRGVLVKDSTQAETFVKQFNDAAEQSGQLKPDRVKIVTYDGPMDLGVGHRIVATGSTKAKEPHGLAGGESGEITAIGKHPDGKSRGTYLTVQMDGGAQDGREAVRHIRVKVAGEDRGLPKGRAVEAIRGEHYPYASEPGNPEGNRAWAKSLNAPEVQSRAFSEAIVVPGSKTTYDQVIEMAAKSKGGVQIHSTHYHGDADTLGARFAKEEAARAEPRDYSEIRQRIESPSLHVSAHQNDAKDRQVEAYEPVPVAQAHQAYSQRSAELLTHAINGTQEAGVTTFLNAVKDSGRYGLHANEEAATRAAADSLAARVVADKGAEQPRSRGVLVKDSTQAETFVKQFNDAAEQSGQLKPDRVKIVTYDGPMDLGVGHRIVATGSTKAKEPHGLAGGESGEITAIGKHPDGKSRGTYLTVQMDGGAQDGREAVRHIRVKVAGEDRGLPKGRAVEAIRGEHYPYASEPGNPEGNRAWAKSINAPEVQSRAFSEAIVVPSSKMSADDLVAVAGMSNGGMEIHSTHYHGDADKLADRMNGRGNQNEASRDTTMRDAAPRDAAPVVKQERDERTERGASAYPTPEPEGSVRGAIRRLNTNREDVPMKDAQDPSRKRGRSPEDQARDSLVAARAGSPERDVRPGR